MTDARGRIELVCLDMAGTTVADDGLVIEAFSGALDELDIGPDHGDRARLLDYVSSTMGESKITVMRSMFDDEDTAQRANAAFEASYDKLLDSDRAEPIPGAFEAITTLKQRGIRVALLTGFSPTTRDHLLESLGWTSLADIALSPADAGRGRPFPDMILAAVVRTATDDVRAVAVAGDTSSDMLSGVRAGASVVAGVLTGAHDRPRLEQAGATHVLSSVVEVIGLVVD